MVVLDDIDINNPTLYFHPNQRVRLRKPSRGKYVVYNYVSESPEIKEEEEDLFENDGYNDFYSDFIRELNLYRSLNNKNNKNNEEYINQRVTTSPAYDFNWYEQHNFIQPPIQDDNNSLLHL
jgi:hypothetical protein